MFENTNLLKTFIELTGNGKTKPFDCVGTFEEVNFAVSLTIQGLEEKGSSLPYLLDYYQKNYELANTSIDITKRYNTKNNLTDEQNEVLRKAVFENDK